MNGGATPLSAFGDNSESAASSSGFPAASGFAADFASADFVSEGLPSGFALASFLSDDLLSELSAAGSRIATRSLSPSMTIMASAFSVARMPLAAAAQSAGSPFG